MKNRLLLKIRENEKKGKKLFCAFLTLGYPNISATGKLIKAFEKIGVDMIELGFPFSDPLADGPTIQYSSEWALERGVRVEDAFRLVRSLRREGADIPILFFSYLNPIFQYGMKRFMVKAKQVGFDGLIVPDLPPGEEPVLQKACRDRGLAQVFLVAPTTLEKRMKVIAKQSRGFIYYVSLRGVTGVRKKLPDDIRATLHRLTKVAKQPVLVGFGVSSPKHGRMLSRMSQGVIVGSAIIERLRHTQGRLEPTIHFVEQLVRSVKGKL